VHTADTSGALELKTNNGTTAVTINTSQAIGVGSTPSFGTSGQFLTSAGSAAPPTWTTVSTSVPQIQPISGSVAASALTISASALALDFRSTTLGSGTVTTVSGTPSNLVVPSTATLGTTSAVQSRLVVIALNNAGTIELAVVNVAGGNNLDETTLLTTTAISAGATSTSVVYSTTARTSVAFRVIGYIESTQATAGTWATAPSTIQGSGGQALTAMSSFGYGQTWQQLIATKDLNTTYYNTTGKPIQVIASVSGTGRNITGNVNGLDIAYGYINGAGTNTVSFTVTPNAYYSCNGAYPGSEVSWCELS
jgi:hypothetical protein